MENLEATIRNFYTSFEKGDYDGMVSHMDEHVTFTDPIFQTLIGEEVRSMAKMFSKTGDSAKKFTIEKITTSENAATVNWVANYKFSKTNRQIANHITSPFTFKNGKIASYEDQFDLYKWCRMAFGPTGVVLGWTPFFHNAIRKSIRKTLSNFREKEKQRAS